MTNTAPCREPLKIWIKVVWSWLPKQRRFPIYQSSHLGFASRTCTQVRPWRDKIKSILCKIFSESQIFAIFLTNEVNILQYFWKCWDWEATCDSHISILQNMHQNKRDICGLTKESFKDRIVELDRNVCFGCVRVVDWRNKEWVWLAKQTPIMTLWHSHLHSSIAIYCYCYTPCTTNTKMLWGQFLSHLFLLGPTHFVRLSILQDPVSLSL